MRAFSAEELAIRLYDADHRYGVFICLFRLLACALGFLGERHCRDNRGFSRRLDGRYKFLIYPPVGAIRGVYFEPLPFFFNYMCTNLNKRLFIKKKSIKMSNI